MTSYLYEIENHNFKEVNWQDVVGHFVYMLIDSKTRKELLCSVGILIIASVKRYDK